MASDRAERGIVLCGSGIGVSIAVNRNPTCRCALVNDPVSARLGREHNDANVIALGARLMGFDMAKACVTAFLETEFAGAAMAGASKSSARRRFPPSKADGGSLHQAALPDGRPGSEGGLHFSR